MGIEKRGPMQNFPSSLNKLSYAPPPTLLGSWEWAVGTSKGVARTTTVGIGQDKEGGPWYHDGDWADKTGQHQLQARADSHC